MPIMSKSHDPSSVDLGRIEPGHTQTETTLRGAESGTSTGADTRESGCADGEGETPPLAFTDTGDYDGGRDAGPTRHVDEKTKARSSRESQAISGHTVGLSVSVPAGLSDIDAVSAAHQRTTHQRLADAPDGCSSTADTTTPASQDSPRRQDDGESCPECGGRVSVGNERVCNQCGLVVEEDTIDRGPDWRAFDSKERDEKSRVGAPVTEKMHDKGLSTCIGWQDKDAYGNSLSRRKQRQMARLRKWNKRCATKDSTERNLRNAFSEIQRLCSAIDLPEDVTETACVTYRRAQGEGLVNGRSIEAVASAATYIAIRQANIPRTVKTVGELSRVSHQRVSNAFRYLCRELGIGVEPPKVKTHIPSICSELELPAEVEAEAEALVDDAISANIHSGKKPTGLAAAAVYAASLLCEDAEKATQSGAADAGEVCELTIRTRYRELLEVRGKDPKALLEEAGCISTEQQSGSETVENADEAPKAAITSTSDGTPSSASAQAGFVEGDD
jgi:transcription initiation factor TFIIB